MPVHLIKFGPYLLTERDITQIFPVSLHHLLALNDQVQQFSTEFDGLRICHGYGKKAASLKRCGKCSFFWYCDRARPQSKSPCKNVDLDVNMSAINCQVAGWNEKGHKANCKLLKDPDLRGLFVLQWDEFDNHIQFPLHAAEESKCRMTALCGNGTNKVEETQGIATSTGKEVVEPAGKPYATRAIARKGKGLVATTRIAKGTRLLSESRFSSYVGLSSLTDVSKVQSLAAGCIALGCA